MAADVESLYYSHVSRYTTSAFMRLKLGEALRRRDVAPHIFETPQRGPGVDRPARGDGPDGESGK